MNVRKIHIEGVILKAGDEFFALQADQADYEHDGMAVARGWEVLIIRVGDEYHGLYYFLSDDAGQCSRARRILALRHPHMIWMRCWAHQINLMVHSLIKNAGFAAVCKQAIMATNKITASRQMDATVEKCRRGVLRQDGVVEDLHGCRDAMEHDATMLCLPTTNARCMQELCAEV